MSLDPKLAKSRAQESRIAAKVGGKLQPRSGAGPFKKNDVVAKEYDELWECKRTDNTASIRILDKDLVGVLQNALKEGKMGRLTFELNGRDYVVLDLEDYLGRDRLRFSGESVQGDRGSSGSHVCAGSPMDGEGEMPRDRARRGEPILRSVPGQRSRESSEVNMQRDRNTRRPRMSSQVRMPEVRPGIPGDSWGMGRGIRARKTQAPTTD